MRKQSITTLLIGIDGLGGSGKTTYAYELQKQLENSFVFHLDDFIHPRIIRYDKNYQEWYCYYHLQWRYEYLIRKLIYPLKKMGTLNSIIELYDKDTDSYKQKQINIPSGSTVIVEGVFLQRPELRSYFDKVSFINVNKEERLNRALKRDVYIGHEIEIVGKYENRYFPAEEVYMTECDPLTLADEIHHL